MTDETPSGNRWEPTNAAPAESGDAPASPPAKGDGSTGRMASVRRRLRAPGGGSWKVAAATVLLVGSGAGGYAVGHATADQRDEAFRGTGKVPGSDGHDHRFGEVAGQQGRFEGQAPGQPGTFGEGAQ